jgi:hypothetical protein
MEPHSQPQQLLGGTKNTNSTEYFAESLMKVALGTPEEFTRKVLAKKSTSKHPVNATAYVVHVNATQRGSH